MIILEQDECRGLSFPSGTVIYIRGYWSIEFKVNCVNVLREMGVIVRAG